MSPWSFDPDEPDIKKRIEKVIAYYHDSSREETADTLIVQNLTVLSATLGKSKQNNDDDPYVGRAAFTLPVLPVWQNAGQNMHGGIVALLIDVTTTLALATIVSRNDEGDWFWQYPGVSRNLNVSFLKPIPVDSTIRIETVLTGIGKRLATLQAVIRDHETGDVLCTGQHDKVNIDPPKFTRGGSKL